MDPLQPAAVSAPSDSIQELSPAEIQTVIDALPKPAQTLFVRFQALEKLVSALRSDLETVVADVEKVKGDIVSSTDAMRQAIDVVKAVVPSAGPVGERLFALEQKLAGFAAVVKQHFGIKL